MQRGDRGLTCGHHHNWLLDRTVGKSRWQNLPPLAQGIQDAPSLLRTLAHTSTPQSRVNCIAIGRFLLEVEPSTFTINQLQIEASVAASTALLLIAGKGFFLSRTPNKDTFHVNHLQPSMRLPVASIRQVSFPPAQRCS